MLKGNSIFPRQKMQKISKAQVPAENNNLCSNLERTAGIEPASSPWGEKIYHIVKPAAAVFYHFVKPASSNREDGLPKLVLVKYEV